MTPVTAKASQNIESSIVENCRELLSRIFLFVDSQWLIQGRGPGGLGFHLIFSETAHFNATFIFRRAPSLAEGLDPPLTMWVLTAGLRKSQM